MRHDVVVFELADIGGQHNPEKGRHKQVSCQSYREKPCNRLPKMEATLFLIYRDSKYLVPDMRPCAQGEEHSRHEECPVGKVQ